MKSRIVNGSVIWRLPGEVNISSLEAGEGGDKFIISPFEKQHPSLQLNGSIRDLDSREVDQFFDGWAIQSAQDRSSVEKEHYIGWVEKAREEIISGKLSKVVLARQQFVETGIAPAKLFRSLLDHYPNAMVYAFRVKDGICMIGASPETLLYRNGNTLYTEALGGTRTAGLYSDKEMEEHAHIRQYISNILIGAGYDYDAGSTGSRKAGAVEHLETRYDLATKGPEKDLQLAFALHPTSAVCGMPYREALEFIKRTENFDREYYSGFLGPVKANGDFALYVNLRCARLYSGGLVLYAGAGLNGMSDPELEWQETMNKMATIGRWLK